MKRSNNSFRFTFDRSLSNDENLKALIEFLKKHSEVQAVYDYNDGYCVFITNYYLKRIFNFFIFVGISSNGLKFMKFEKKDDCAAFLDDNKLDFFFFDTVEKLNTVERNGYPLLFLSDEEIVDTVMV